MKIAIKMYFCSSFFFIFKLVYCMKFKWYLFLKVYLKVKQILHEHTLCKCVLYIEIVWYM